MTRSTKKGPFIDPKLLKKVLALKQGDKTAIKTWSRDSTISPEMVGFYFAVHNGKDFIQIFTTEDMVGYKLGEFSPSKKFVKHGGKIQKDLETKVASTAAEAPKAKAK
jgi:small subunit ribosomal protein S19